MSACEYKRKEILKTTRNVVEDIAENYGSVIHKSHTTTIKFKGETVEERQKDYDNFKAWVEKENKAYNSMNRGGSNFDFINVSANEDFTEVKVDYKYMEVLKDTVNAFHKKQREYKEAKKLNKKQRKEINEWENYDESVRAYEKLMATNDNVKINQARVDTLKEVNKALNEDKDNPTVGKQFFDPNNIPNIEEDVSIQAVKEGTQKVDFVDPSMPRIDIHNDLDTVEAIIKSRNNYSKHIRRYLYDLNRNIDKYKKEYGKNPTEENARKYHKARELHARMKLLWLNSEKYVKNMDANEYMQHLLQEMNILQRGIVDINKYSNDDNLSLLYQRVNFIEAMLNGKGFDGNTVKGTLAALDNETLRYVRSYFEDIKNDLHKVATHYTIEKLLDNKIFADNMSSMGITDLKGVMEQMIAKGDISLFNRSFTGISSAQSDVGFLPEMMKVMFHEIHMRYVAESNDLKQKVKDADKAVGEDKSFAFEVINGKKTGRLNYWFKSVWTDMLNAAEEGIERMNVYNQYAERIDYTLIPELHDMFGSLWSQHFTKSTEDQQAYKEYLISKVGEPVYNRMVNRMVDKLQEFNSLELQGEDVSKFDPFGEFKGLHETFYMEFIPKEDRHFNHDYYNMTEEQRQYIDTIILANKTFVATNMQDYNTLNFGKLSLGLLESIKTKEDVAAKGKELLRASTRFLFRKKKGFKAETVQSKYVDEMEVFREDIEENLRDRTIEELMQFAADRGIEISPEIENRDEILHHIATGLNEKSFEDDLTKATNAIVDIAADVAARTDMLPMAQNMFKLFEVNNFDKKGVQTAMSKFINNVLIGLNDNDLKIFDAKIAQAIKLENVTTLKDVTKYSTLGKRIEPNDRAILDIIEDSAKKDLLKDEVKFFDTDGNHYFNDTRKGRFFMNGKQISMQEFETQYARSLVERINKTGVPLTIGSIFNSLNAIILHKFLAFSPLSGFINRVQGMSDNGMADMSGHYWTTGNVFKAQKFLNLFNVNGYAKGKTTFVKNMIPKSKKAELEKLNAFIESLSLSIGRENSLALRWAIGDPENKNQAEVLLSLMQDMTIKNANGEEFQLFDGDGFPAFEVIDDRIRLKPEFRTDDNVDMYENFVKGEDGSNPIAELVTKFNRAIGDIHDNRDKHDITTKYNNILMSTMSMLKRWIISGWFQRMASGEGRDYTFNKKKKEGRFRTAIRRPGTGLSFAAGNIALVSGLGAGAATVAGLGVGVGALYLGYKYYMRKVKKKELQTAAINADELLTFWKATMLSTLDFPVRVVAGRSVFNYQWLDPKNGRLTKEEVGNIKALGMELGNSIAFLGMTMAVLAALHDDDDDESVMSKKFYNYMSNRLSAFVYNGQIFLNPVEAIKTLGNVGIVQFADSVSDLLKAVSSGEWSELSEEKRQSMLVKALPIPNVFANTLVHGNPFQTDKEVAGKPIMNMYKTEEDMYKKQSSVITENIRYKLKEKGYGRDRITKIKYQLVGKRKKGESQKHYYERIKPVYDNIDWNKY